MNERDGGGDIGLSWAGVGDGCLRGAAAGGIRIPCAANRGTEAVACNAAGRESSRRAPLVAGGEAALLGPLHGGGEGALLCATMREGHNRVGTLPIKPHMYWSNGGGLIPTCNSFQLFETGSFEMGTCAGRNGM